MKVRMCMTSARLAPCASRMLVTISKMCSLCAPTSPGATTRPDSSTATCPESTSRVAQARSSRATCANRSAKGAGTPAGLSSLIAAPSSRHPRDGHPYHLAFAGLPLERAVGGSEGESGRERLGGHEVAVRLHRRDHLGPGVDGDRDPVADVEPGLAAGLLNHPYHVARQTLGGQLGGDRGVGDDDALGHRRGAVRVGGDELELVLALAQLDTARAHHAVGDRPVPRLDRPDDLLYLATEAGAEDPGHHGQHPFAVAGEVSGE